MPQYNLQNFIQAIEINTAQTLQVPSDEFWEIATNAIFRISPVNAFNNSLAVEYDPIGGFNRFFTALNSPVFTGIVIRTTDKFIVPPGFYLQNTSKTFILKYKNL